MATGKCLSCGFVLNPYKCGACGDVRCRSSLGSLECVCTF